MIKTKDQQLLDARHLLRVWACLLTEEEFTAIDTLLLAGYRVHVKCYGEQAITLDAHKDEAADLRIERNITHTTYEPNPTPLQASQYMSRVKYQLAHAREYGWLTPAPPPEAEPAPFSRHVTGG